MEALESPKGGAKGAKVSEAAKREAAKAKAAERLEAFAKDSSRTTPKGWANRMRNGLFVAVPEGGPKREALAGALGAGFGACMKAGQEMGATGAAVCIGYTDKPESLPRKFNASVPGPFCVERGELKPLKGFRGKHAFIFTGQNSEGQEGLIGGAYVDAKTGAVYVLEAADLSRALGA